MRVFVSFGLVTMKLEIISLLAVISLSKFGRRFYSCVALTGLLVTGMQSLFGLMKGMKVKVLLSVILKTCMESFSLLYSEGSVRNVRIFTQISQVSYQIVENIREDVALKIVGLSSIKDDEVNRNLT